MPTRPKTRQLEAWGRGLKEVRTGLSRKNAKGVKRKGNAVKSKKGEKEERNVKGKRGGLGGSSSERVQGYRERD